MRSDSCIDLTIAFFNPFNGTTSSSSDAGSTTNVGREEVCAVAVAEIDKMYAYFK